MFNYLLEYSQAQQLKLLQKQDEDWSQIAAISGKQLVVRESSSSQTLLQQISQKFTQIRNRIDGPFSEAHVKFLRAQASPFRRPK